MTMTKTNLQQWFLSTEYFSGTVHPYIICNDGTTLSVQASQYHYCSPRVDKEMCNARYYQVEVFCVSTEVPESWLEFGDNVDNPFAYIPTTMVEEFIDLHGGIKA